MKKLNKEERFIVKMLIVAMVGLLVARYGSRLTDNVRQQTIKEAVLVESNESGYILSFNGEEHVYTYN